MQITLFGASGFVGSHILRESVHDVIPNAREDYEPKSPDILFSVGTTDNYNVFSNPFVDIESNVVTLIKVLEFARSKFPRFTFNFLSSWFVYGSQNLPFDENDPCDPKGFYSISKRTAEQLLMSYCKTFNVNYRILRLGNVYGVGDKGISNKKNALQYLLARIRNNLPVELYSGGEILRDYIHVSDVVKAIDLIVQNGKPNDIYNIGTGKSLVLKDILLQAKEVWKSSSEFTSIDPPKFHQVVQVKDCVLNVSKLKSLGFQPTKDLMKEITTLC